LLGVILNSTTIITFVHLPLQSATSWRDTDLWCEYYSGGFLESLTKNSAYFGSLKRMKAETS